MDHESKGSDMEELEMVELESALAREYMKACLRLATGNSNLDNLNDHELRSTWIAAGKPKVSFEEWKSAMLSVSEFAAEPDVEETGVIPDPEAQKKINEAAIKAIKAKAEKGKVDAGDTSRSSAVEAETNN
jgi:hypothetical protein